jgi:Ricin-type beta-trefoil lectin domain
LPSVGAGNLQTVAVVAPYDDPNAAADLAIYRSNYALNPCTSTDGCFREVNESGQPIPPNAPAGNTGWALTTSAQLDAVSAVCPNCHILLVEVNSPGITNVGTGVTTAVALGATAITIGVSQPEVTADTSYDSDYFASTRGVAVTVAAGNNGYQPPGSPLGYPAASQYVTAVGGTTLTPAGSGTCTAAQAGLRGWCESAWNGLADTANPVGTESGCSLYDPQPTWQAGPAGTSCGSQRESVDVTADADPATGIAVYDSDGEGGWQATGTGGTAVAAAIVAAVYALAGTSAAGTYPAAYPYSHPGSLNDVASGNNLAPSQAGCTPTSLCTAGTGYDGPSGLGSPRGTLSFTAAGSQTGPLYNGIGNMCADDYGNASTSGNKIQIWACLGDAAQNWTIESDGTVQINGKCLDVTGGVNANGTKIQLWACLNGDANQQWQPEPNGELVNPETGRCLDNYDVASTNYGTDNGTQLDIWSCNGNPNQQWALPYPQPAAQDRIVSAYPAPAPMCADDNHGNSTDGNKVDTWQCNNGAGAQEWTVAANGTIQIEGKCLDATDHEVTPGTTVQLWSCIGGTNQQWRVLSDGAIQGLESGLCLDEGSTTTNGVQLVIGDCNTDAAQTWLLTPYQNNY